MARNPSAQTRAAFLASPRKVKSSQMPGIVSDWVGRGYNTLILPYLADGHLEEFSRRDHSPSPFSALLTSSLTRRDLSSWISVDPLSAGPPGGGLSKMADRRREWLMRNTRGHTAPLGASTTDPLFSWVNIDWRRYLAEKLLLLASGWPITGIVLDFRRMPLPSSDPTTWFCCSFVSQARAEAELAMRFEDLLTRARPADVERWQNWVFSEARTFVEYLKARVSVVRRDIGWKVLIPPPDPSLPPRAMPWFRWLSDGTVGEALVETAAVDGALERLLSAIDQSAGTLRPILPVFSQRADLDRSLLNLPVPGFAVRKPDVIPPSKLDDALPRSDVTWEVGGAVEDHPLHAIHACLDYLIQELGQESNLARYYRTLQKHLRTAEDDPILHGKIAQSLRGVEQRIAKGEIPLEGSQRHLTRVISLMNRLLGLVEPLPVLV